VGALKVDVESYTDRVVYRLGKWLGLTVEVPDYSEDEGPPHR
jgi:hypothetical protein